MQRADGWKIPIRAGKADDRNLSSRIGHNRHVDDGKRRFIGPQPKKSDVTGGDPLATCRHACAVTTRRGHGL